MTGIETIIKIAGVGLLAAIINSILDKSDKRELSTFVTLTALVIVLVMVITMVADLLGTVKSLFNLF
ncbi:MAG: stage III sporulation protein AC [Clostridia bacterium]|nr:stage III sporulation protein AC [Clostridia bacterium]